MGAHWRMSRFAPSELTFGAVGRVVATILFLSPAYFVLSVAGVFGLVFITPYLVSVVPDGLRWLWQRVPVELVDDPLPPMDVTAEPPPPGAAIADREAPSRW
jgi:hypothetical protein